MVTIGAYLLDLINEDVKSEFNALLLGKDSMQDVTLVARIFPYSNIFSAELIDDDIDQLSDMDIRFKYIVITDLIENDENWNELSKTIPLLDGNGQIIIACPNSININMITELMKYRYTKKEKGIIDYSYSDIADKVTDLNLLIGKFGLFGDYIDSGLEKEYLIQSLGMDYSDEVNAIFLPYIRLSLKNTASYMDNEDIFPDTSEGLKGYVKEYNAYNMFNLVMRKDNQDQDYYMKHLDPVKKEIKFHKEANEVLKNKILDGKPFCALRLGNTEGILIDNYISNKLDKTEGYSGFGMNYAINSGGFFVTDFSDTVSVLNGIDDFVRLQLRGFRNADIMMMWGACRMEAVLANHFVIPSCDNISYFSLIPYVEDYEPWTAALAGKKVLVVTSVPESIEYQYKRKDAISPYKISTLPDFTLITYRMIQTCQQDKKNFESWFDALESVQKEILDIDFDIAIVGAGFYGVPLCDAIKKAGKIAIEMCGLTPFIFGVAGKRFIQDQKDFYGKYMTDAWIRPIDEKPSWYTQVEGGCYW